MNHWRLTHILTAFTFAVLTFHDTSEEFFVYADHHRCELVADSPSDKAFHAAPVPPVRQIPSPHAIGKSKELSSVRSSACPTTFAHTSIRHVAVNKRRIYCVYRE